MSAIVWANVLLTLPFLIAFIAVPLVWTFTRPPAAADHHRGPKLSAHSHRLR